jgi:antitoxin (DNA-binding transcriptional repressor) of toxin-antitoxin stability system
MKTVTIRELHSRTGQLVRQAAHHGEIRITDYGRVVAKLVPESVSAEAPYFARRRYVSPRMKRLIESGSLGSGGTDSTATISVDREDRT